jgi:hypothetical protein
MRIAPIYGADPHRRAGCASDLSDVPRNDHGPRVVPRARGDAVDRRARVFEQDDQAAAEKVANAIYGA